MAETLPALYQRYKRGTKVLCQFLAERANECGKLTGMPAPTPEHAASTKKKGKHTQQGDRTVKLSVKQLKRLASSVRTASSTGNLSLIHLQEIIAITQDVIFCRQEYAIWYQQQRNLSVNLASSQQGDDGHEHFLNALKFILTALKEAKGDSRPLATGASDAKVPRPDASQSIPFFNKFAELEVEDESWMENTDEHTVPLDCKVKKQSGLSTFELLLDGNDDAFALWCFLKDCRAVRTFLQDRWSEYAKGDLSLFVVTNLTKIALCQVQVAAIEFASDFPDLSDFDRVAQFLQIKLSTLDNKVCSFSCNDTELPKGEDEHPSAAADLLCLPALIVLSLQRLRRQLQETTAHEEKVYDSPFCVALETVLIQLYALLGSPERQDFGGLDNFTEMYLRFLEDPIITLDLAFWFQTNMDIWDIIEDRRCHPQAYLHVVAERFELFTQHYNEIERHFKDEGKYDGKVEAEIQRDAIRNLIARGIRTPVVEDQLEAFFGKPRDKGDGEDGAREYCNPMIVILPLLAGSLATKITWSHYTDGILACNRGHIVLAMAHLYTACRSTGLLDTPWPDMDHVIAMFGGQALGLRATEGSAAPSLAAARNYGLALGVPGKAYANSKKLGPDYDGPVRPLLPHRRRGPGQRIPNLEPRSLYFDSFSASHQTNTVLGFELGDANCDAMQRMVRAYLDGGADGIEPSITSQWSQTRQLQPAQMLSVVRVILAQEKLKLHFQLHIFAAHCASLLASINLYAEDAVALSRDTYGMSPDFRPHEMVDELLWQAVRIEALPRRGRAQFDAESPTWLARCAAEQLLPHIERHGSKILDNAKMISSGYASEELEPDTSYLEFVDPRESVTGFHLSLEGDKLEVNSPLGDLEEQRRREQSVRATAIIHKWLVREDFADAERNARMREDLTQMRDTFDKETARLKELVLGDEVSVADGCKAET